MLGLCSCDYLESKKNNQQVTDTINDLKKLVHSSQKDSLAEFKKVYQIEYKTLIIPFDKENPKTSGLSIAQNLNDLGRERWNCFAVERSEHNNELSFVLFLQRPIETPLRYLPGSLISK